MNAVYKAWTIVSRETFVPVLSRASLLSGNGGEGPRRLELAAAAEAPEGSRQERLQRFRLDPQILQGQRTRRHDIVVMQEAHLIARQHRIRKELQDACLQHRYRKGNRHEPALPSRLAQHDLQNLAERIDARTAELIGFAARCRIGKAAFERLRD